jgi:Cu2+-exporting ATPase
VDNITTYGELTSNEVLRLAASMEVNSDHPLAKAILAKNRQPLYPAENWTYQTAQGISATINTADYFIGSAKFIQQKTGLQIDYHGNESSVLMAERNALVARFEFRQALRDGVHQVIEHFKSTGKSIIMLTGDTPGPAHSLARELGIQQVYSECKPEDKLKIVRNLQTSETACILMIGDGINDSPVLAAADVSIAVAGASPLAVSGADIVMAQPGIESIITLDRCSIRTSKIVRQNISWAVGYNLIAIPFAACGIVTPLFAAIGMSLSSLIVVLNAQRLRRKY